MTKDDEIRALYEALSDSPRFEFSTTLMAYNEENVKLDRKGLYRKGYQVIDTAEDAEIICEIRAERPLDPLKALAWTVLFSMAPRMLAELERLAAEYDDERAHAVIARARRQQRE